MAIRGTTDFTVSSREVAAHKTPIKGVALSTDILLLLRPFVDIYCTVHCLQEFIYTSFSSCTVICIGFVNIETGKSLFFLHEINFNLWHHDARIPLRRYVGKRNNPVCVIGCHIGRTTGVIIWGAVTYYG